MFTEPEKKRAVVFFDGQNLFHRVKKVFAYRYPNYDPIKLAEAVCKQKGWELSQVRFYTGIPSIKGNGKNNPRNKRWHTFWSSKLRILERKRIAKAFKHDILYRETDIQCPHDKTVHTIEIEKEKGVDVKIAIDIINLAYDKSYDVCVVFSQDQDLFEATEEAKKIAIDQARWIRVASAFIHGDRNNRGIHDTDWIEIDKTTYDACIDQNKHGLPSDY